MREFCFDTGVRYSPNALHGQYQVWRNGTKQILFYCDDVPENAGFMFGSQFANEPEAKLPNVIVRQIIKGGIVSKYAYFRLPAVN